MLPLIAHRRDPAPSRIRYRLQRLWLKQSFRWFVWRGLPLGLGLGASAMVVTDPGIQGWVGAQYDAARVMIAARPELRVESMTILNASPDLRDQIVAVIGMDLPISALDLDLAGLRAEVEHLDAVKTASVRITSGILQIDVVERQPVVLWRLGAQLAILDETGARVAIVPARAAQPNLPLIAGEGADSAVDDALRLMRVATPLGTRLRGLVRVGGRRWDIVLDNDQVIKLPEQDGANALRRVLALQSSDHILDLDISVVDMRDAGRPILRLNPDALRTLRAQRAVERDEAI